MATRTWRQRLVAVLYPERCCGCGKVVVCGELVCAACRQQLVPILPPLCPLCGRHIADCRCGKHQRHTDRCIAAFYYEGAARAAIHRLKFKDKPYAAELLYEAMTQAVMREYAGISFDCIIPVPISAQTRRVRGYNQSALLAKGLSQRLGIPWSETLVKCWHTAAQRDLPAYRRSGNVLGVFDTNGSIPLAGTTILLVDDTNTTGATMDECAKMLKIYGAAAVYAVTAAATRLSKE